MDGLRAVAIVPVLFYHAGFRPAVGGFVGVDVFFVISGYLITSIILGDLERGSFSLFDFYERRARRILPALYAVLIAVIPFGYAWMLPDEFAGFLRTTLATVFFVSNFDLLQHTGYFGPDVTLNPLLHTWSLAVEEQYYLLVPLILMLCWARGLRAVALVLAAITLGSLALAEVGWRHWPEASFLMQPYRAWELGIGALSAVALWRWPDLARHRGLAEVGGIAGLGLIAASILTFDRTTPHPSLWTLAPVGGAALVILCADGRTLAGRLLSLRPAVFLGLLSYSAYLWHQPILALARIRSLYELSDAGRLGAIALSLVLAWLTWRYIERPFRDRMAMPRPAILRFGVAASAALVALSAAGIGGAALRADSPPHLRQIFDVTNDQRYAYVVEAHDAETVEAFSADDRGKLLLIGDSYSQDFYNMVREVGAFADHEVAAAFREPWCQVYIGDDDVTRFIEPGRRAECLPAEAWNARTVDLARQADVIVLAARWEKWSAARLPETIASLGLHPGQTLFVVGRKSFGSFNVRALYGADPEQLPRVRARASPDALAVNHILRRQLPPEQFVDVQAMICAGGRECPLFTPGGGIISYDGGHLTERGARFVGARVFEDPRLRKYLGAEG